MNRRLVCDHVIDVTGGKSFRTDHELMTLADRVARLCPSPRHPDRFHEDKSEIVDALERLAREVGFGRTGPSAAQGRGAKCTRQIPRLTGAR